LIEAFFRLKAQAPGLSRGLCLLIFFLRSSAVFAEAGRFSDLFAVVKKVTLQDSKLKFGSLLNADVAPGDRISGIDWKESSDRWPLKIFSSGGQLEHKILVTETAPYRSSIVWDVAVNKQSQLIVAGDGQLFVYDSLGHLLKIFKTASDKEKEKTKKDVWGANITRLDVGPKGEIAGAGIGFPTLNYLHLYNQEGKLLKEFFLLDSKYDESLLQKNPKSIDIDSVGDIWCTFPYLYKVFRYGMDGKQKGEIAGKSRVYKAPQRLNGPMARKERVKWLQTWTVVADCAATQSGYVILVMTAGEKGKSLVPVYDPESDINAGGFFIDIYDREGNLIAGGLHTPHRFLTVDKQDYIWFDLRPGTPENPGKDGPAVLGKFKLNLKPVTTQKVNSKPSGRRK